MSWGIDNTDSNKPNPWTMNPEPTKPTNPNPTNPKPKPPTGGQGGSGSGGSTGGKGDCGDKRKNVKRDVIETRSPFIDSYNGVKSAYGNEIHVFLHCHLRGYDKDGTGISMCSDYFDKYGAPVSLEDSWHEGYHVVELELARHFNLSLNPFNNFPVVAGLAGGAHIYVDLHNDKPENWTGWVPQQRRWVAEHKDGNMYYFLNRYFLTLRGNEIQNNLWDYHPHDEADAADEHDMIYEQIAPTGPYRGGYWFKGNTNGRYVHIMALKTHLENAKRYNFYVHPLAYRSSIDSLPDSNVDGIQWSVMNSHLEGNFTGSDKRWGEKINGIELFNDFTYYYSWLEQEEGKPHQHKNGRLHDPNAKEGEKIICWHDTYPFEYCDFLIENALARGVYLHTLSANDAFYSRATMPTNSHDLEGNIVNQLKEQHKVLRADPKGNLIKPRHMLIAATNEKKTYLTRREEEREELGKRNPVVKESNHFLRERPYEYDTAFGYTALLDTRRKLFASVFPKSKAWPESLESGELVMMDKLIGGQFFGHTGVFDVFDYSFVPQCIPFEIVGQEDKDNLCFEMTGDMELIFDFAPCQDKNLMLIWQYTLERTLNDAVSPQAKRRRGGSAQAPSREVVHGYFRLDCQKVTRLDLSATYNKSSVKWIRFTAYSHVNPGRRAWFSPIKCPGFGDPVTEPVIENGEDVTLSVPINRVTRTCYGSEVDETRYIIVEDTDCPFEPTEVAASENLIYTTKKGHENMLNVYYMLAYPNQQVIPTDETKVNFGPPPPRILQNVNGYFQLSAYYPTRMELGNSWDASTVVDGKVYFYSVIHAYDNDSLCLPQLYKLEVQA